MKLKTEQIYNLTLLIAVVVATSVITHRCDRYHQQQNKVIKVERDTVIKYDTIPQYYPKPVEVEKVRTEYQWLPIAKIVHDTVGFTKFVNDSVLVEVPITSKHYHSDEYDAYVSGYMPSLDSIFTRNKTEIRTEIRTISKQPNKFELDVLGGIDYTTKSQQYTPYVVGQLLYKPSRFHIGIYGGVVKTNKVEPIVGMKGEIRIF